MFFLFIPVVMLMILTGCWRPPPLYVYSIPSADAVGPSFSIEYTVQEGDTAYRIANCHGIELEHLVSLNKLEAPYLIRIGQKIRLPNDSRRSNCFKSLETVGTDSNNISEQARNDDFSEQYVISPPALPASKIAELKTPPGRSGSKFLWPVEGTLLSKFGPKPGNLRNDGINILAPIGSPVRAAENGVVAYAGNELRGYGNMLLVRHDGGWITAYAHNSELLVERGAIVVRGEVIAKVGQSGNVDKPQTHFEIRLGDKAVDPFDHLTRE